jgi:hypothetical protein
MGRGEGSEMLYERLLVRDFSSSHKRLEPLCSKFIAMKYRDEKG